MGAGGSDEKIFLSNLNEVSKDCIKALSLSPDTRNVSWESVE